MLRMNWLGLFSILFSPTPGLSAVEGFHVGLRLLQSPGLGEGGEAAVVAFLDTIREAAAGQLLARQMIAYTLTARPLPLTAGI